MMWIDRGDKMNELQICNENQALIDMQIDACNTAVNFLIIYITTHACMLQ